MDKDAALQLLKGGVKGVLKWNKWRQNPNNHPPSLQGVNLHGTRLYQAHLHQLNLRGAILCESQLYRASLAYSDLTGADLQYAQLEDADLNNATLVEANLQNAYAPGASFAEASLGAAKISNAYFRLTDLSGAKLERVEARNTNLTGAILRLTTLAGSDLTSSLFELTVICDTDLSEVLGLDTVKHSNRSFVDGATLQRSLDVPESFLRGCGLTDWEIEATKLYRRGISNAQVKEIVDRINQLRTTMPSELHSCFISYSHQDKDFAIVLYDSLQARGVRCWLDQHDVFPGQRIHEVVYSAIQTYDRVLLCCSEASLTSSWVDDEIATATERERLAADFREWRGDEVKFQNEMRRVLRAITNQLGTAKSNERKST